jgi:hypothetical protein
MEATLIDRTETAEENSVATGRGRLTMEETDWVMAFRVFDRRQHSHMLINLAFTSIECVDSLKGSHQRAESSVTTPAIKLGIQSEEENTSKKVGEPREEQID